MRVLILIAAAATVLSWAPRPSEAAYNRAWCAKYADYGGITSCAFDTYRQCLATLSGIGGSCVENPAAPPPPPPYYRRPKQQRDDGQR